MKRTVLEKIAGLKRMIYDLENPELVMKETKEIFADIDALESGIERDKALFEMTGVAIGLMKEMEESSLDRLIDILGKKVKTKVVEVEVKVNEYKNVTQIEINKRLPYSELLAIINKTRKNFEETRKDLLGASYHKIDKNLLIEYKEDTQKDIIIEMSNWNMSTEVAEVYIDGLVEYINK